MLPAHPGRRALTDALKFLCPSCERLTALADFRVEGSSLWLRCTACGAESEAQGREPAPAPAPGRPTLRSLLQPALPEVPQGFCPKCVAPKGAGPSCAACGLVYANFDPAGFSPSEPLQALWSEAQGRDDEPAHRRLLTAAKQSGELALIGRLYRIRLAANPQDAAAERWRREIVELAAKDAELMASEAPPVDLSERRKQVGLWVVIVFALGLGALLMRQLVRMAAE